MITFLVSTTLILLMGFCIFLYLHGDPNTEDSSKYADYDCRSCAYFVRQTKFRDTHCQVRFGHCIKHGEYSSVVKRFKGDNCGYVRKT